MALDFLTNSYFTGPAFPEPFVRHELENELAKKKLLPKTAGEEGKKLQKSWEEYRRKLRELAVIGGHLRVKNHVLDPLIHRLGYEMDDQAEDVQTREGLEKGGWIFIAADKETRIRVWAAALDEDLDAPAKRGAAYRYSHVRVAQRVLLAKGERIGLITNGVELRILISDPARPDSQVTIPIDPHWKRTREVPDSYLLLLALASPEGVKAIPDLVDKARLQQTQVTKELRVQAKEAIRRFVQDIIDHPENKAGLAAHPDREKLAKALWHEGLITVYRLLFILKLEATDDTARTFSFASSSLWRKTYSPSQALAPIARKVIDQGAETGGFLENGLRSLFRMFEQGIESTELNVKPLGGALFGPEAAPIISGLKWSEKAVADLLDMLLWTTPKRKKNVTRERVHYGPLDVEDLGRVYEALLELEPGIASEPMCRLRRQKLEVVVPMAQGEKYRTHEAAPEDADLEDQDDDEPEEDEDEAPSRGKKTKVEWIEEIKPGRFYLRVGLGRKASGSYYTPHSFVRFLVQETCGPQADERSPKDDPRPMAILGLKVLDPAMGSGHFLVEACRFLGDKLYEACRLCDDKATDLRRKAETAKPEDREKLLKRADDYIQRVVDLPDPENEMLTYLPSRAPEGQESGVSQKKALALCKRMVAVHCLYGVDKNPLAAELAKLSLWIESHSEGYPLTFMDHRLVVGDSLTGPFFEHLLKYPGSQKPMDDLFTQGLKENFTAALEEALKHVKDLERSVGISLSDLSEKQKARALLERALAPFKVIAAAWAGGVMLGIEGCDDTAYAELVKNIVEPSNSHFSLHKTDKLSLMIKKGLGTDQIPDSLADIYKKVTFNGFIPSITYELTFPDAFYPDGQLALKQGFHVVLGNPPWDRMLPADKEYFASYNFDILNAPTKRERSAIEKELLKDHDIRLSYDSYISDFRSTERAIESLYNYQVAIIDGEKTIGKQDIFRLFMERNAQLLHPDGLTGVVVPSAFHANEGATAIRQLYLEKMGLTRCFSFENRHKLFEIDSRFKFAMVVAKESGPTTDFDCAFYLHDDEWLFGDRAARDQLNYTLDFVRRTGGDYLSLLELRSKQDLEIAETCFKNGIALGTICRDLKLEFGRELNMTDDSWRFTPTVSLFKKGEDPRHPDVAENLRDQEYLILHEGKTFWHYSDFWEDPPTYVVSLAKMNDKLLWIKAAQYYRPAYRSIAASTNERTVIFHIFPPGATFGNSAPVNREPWKSPCSRSLILIAAANTFAFDWTARVRTGSNLNMFILFSCPFPNTDKWERFLRTQALRLVCNHSGYENLWKEQFGDEWREKTRPLTWPIFKVEDERWEIRSAVDAVIANAYSLSRPQYEHVLSTFSHKGYSKASELCLAKFDELQKIGREKFTKKYDPYWDIPLNENLPEPVIDLPIPEDSEPRPMTLLDYADDEDAAKAKKTGSRGRVSTVDPDDKYNALMDLLRRKKELSNSDVQAALDLDPAQARAILKRLVDDGHATTKGKARGLKYIYTKSE